MVSKEKKMQTESTKELLEALPKAANSDPTGERLAAFVAKLDSRRVPVNSFSRMWLLGSLQAKVVFGYMAY